MITVYSSGSWRVTEDFLTRMQSQTYLLNLEHYGAAGVDALRSATPEDTGATADSWIYEIVQRPGYYSIKWDNTHVVEPGHIPVAVLIQYGHGTKEGAYVQGLDFINPAMRAIFEQIVTDMWREVTRNG